MRTERSHSNIRSHASHYQETQKLQREIDRLRSKLRRRERGKRSPSPPLSDGSKGSRDRLYCHRSRTPSNESSLASTHKNRYERSSHDPEKQPCHHGMGNDAMSKALQQISKSTFVRRINKARLPRRFSQPTFCHLQWED